MRGLRSVLVALVLGLGFGQGLAWAAGPDCSGTNLIAALPPDQLALLRAGAAAEPFSQGNFWLAQKGDEVVTLAGTLHLDDPRFDRIAAALRIRVAASGLVMVEAGPDEQSAMKSAIFKDPSLILSPAGAGVQDRLTNEQWAALTRSLTARGLPAIMAQRMRPWMLMAVLAVPPCEAKSMLAAGREAPNGLDQRLISLAQEFKVPVQGLEPWDAALKTLTGLAPDQELQLLTASLALDSQADDITATLRDSYFAGESRLFWQFYRSYAVTALAAIDPALAKAAAKDTEAALALLEGPLIRDRNRAWIAVIETAAARSDKPILVAFGALHLPGAGGVLNLLAQGGWTITPLSLAGP